MASEDSTKTRVDSALKSLGLADLADLLESLAAKRAAPSTAAPSTAAPSTAAPPNPADKGKGKAVSEGNSKNKTVSLGSSSDTDPVEEYEVSKRVVLTRGEAMKKKQEALKRKLDKVSKTQSQAPEAKKAKTVPASSSKRPTRSKRPAKDDADKSGAKEEVQKALVHELTLDFDWLKAHKLEEVSETLNSQGWGNLFQAPGKVNEEQVRQFYSSLAITEKSGMSSANFKINSEDFGFDSRDIAKWLKVDHDGFADYVKRSWPDYVAKKEVMNRVGSDASKMNIAVRTLHRLLVQNLCPRMQKHDQLTHQDYLIMDHLLLHKKVSLPRQIMQHMAHAIKEKSHGLPYPTLVKKILIKKGVYKAENEVPVTKAFDKFNCEALGFKFDEVQGWIKEGTEAPLPKDSVAGERDRISELEDKYISLSRIVMMLKEEFADRLSKAEEEIRTLKKMAREAGEASHTSDQN